MVDRYAGERYAPRVPVCGRSLLSLHFDGRILNAHNSRKIIFYPAVSGRPSKGSFDYSKERQAIKDQGPIPEGEYWVQPSEFQKNAWYRLRNPRTAWGDTWITIHPFPGTQTYQRGGFFIHGGSTPGSAGCIDLSMSMNRFAQALAEELEGKRECFIPLQVHYRQ